MNGWNVGRSARTVSDVVPAAVIALVALVAALATPATASAQSANGNGFDVENFEPGASQHSSLLNLDRPEVLGHLVPSAGLFVHFVDDPLQVVAPNSSSIESRVIDDQLKAEVGLAMGFFDVVELDVTLPMVAYQSGGALSRFGGSGVAEGFSLSDTRLTLKAALVRPEQARGFGVALSGTMVVPSGNTDTFDSDGAVSGEPRVSFR